MFKVLVIVDVPNSVVIKLSLSWFASTSDFGGGSELQWRWNAEHIVLGTIAFVKKYVVGN